jgi:hypothetical protein
MRYTQFMADKKTQKTPTGYEIPVPTRGEFYANLKKTAKPPKRSTRKGRPKQ